MYEVTTGGKRTEVELIAAQPRGKNVLRQRGRTSVAEDADEENPATTEQRARRWLKFQILELLHGTSREEWVKKIVGVTRERGNYCRDMEDAKEGPMNESN